MAVLAITEDLLFASKLEAAARAAGLTFFSTADLSDVARQAPAAGWRLILIDLQRAATDPLAWLSSLRRQWPNTSIIAYGSHVETDLLARARQAGFAAVLPRSALIHRLPTFLHAVVETPTRP